MFQSRRFHLGEWDRREQRTNEGEGEEAKVISSSNIGPYEYVQSERASEREIERERHALFNERHLAERSEFVRATSGLSFRFLISYPTHMPNNRYTLEPWSFGASAIRHPRWSLVQFWRVRLQD